MVMMNNMYLQFALENIETIPMKLINIKRKKKGKRYVIYKYDFKGQFYFIGGDE